MTLTDTPEAEQSLYIMDFHGSKASNLKASFERRRLIIGRVFGASGVRAAALLCNYANRGSSRGCSRSRDRKGAAYA